MPTYNITDPQSGQTVRLTGDSPPTEDELNQIFLVTNADVVQPGQTEPVIPEQPPAALKPDYTGASVIEPALAVGSGLASMAAGGMKGVSDLVQMKGTEEAAKTIEETQRAGTFQPKTEAGKAGMQTLGDLVQQGIDLVNFPLSGIGGLLELISGQGVEQAAQTIKDIQNIGAGKTAGKRVLEETDSPLAATVAELIPDFALQKTLFKTAKVAKPTAKAGKDIAEGVFKYQSPTKRRIARMIEEGSTDIETAKFKLKRKNKQPQKSIDTSEDILRLEGPKIEGQKNAPRAEQSKIQKYFDTGGPRVKKDKIAREAIKQGFDEGVVATIKGSSSKDKLIMKRMVTEMQRAKNNARYGMTNRPSDIVGDSLMQRFNVVYKNNRTAGKNLDAVAATLKGQPANIGNAIDKFSSNLDRLGVRLVPGSKGGLKPDFEISVLSPGDRGPLREVIRQMNLASRKGEPDAFAAHQMKRIIDNNVTYGRSKTGISRDAENVLKSFRRDIDQSLDEAFPLYDQVNTIYADTIQVLDAVQDVAGKKMNLSGPNAEKAVGTLMRRLMSNAQSRVNLLDTVNALEKTAKKYGGKFEDDLLTQVLFVDELDSMFAPLARTSLQGQVSQAVDQASFAAIMPGMAAASAAGRGLEKARGINKGNAYKAIKKLLNE